MHLSNKSSRNCRPWGKVISSSPDPTPIIVFCSSVTPVILATCSTKPAEYWLPSICNTLVSRGSWDIWYKSDSYDVTSDFWCGELPGSQHWACAEPLCLRSIGWKAPWAPAGHWAPGVGCSAARAASQNDPTGNMIPTPPVREKTVLKICCRTKAWVVASIHWTAQ